MIWNDAGDDAGDDGSSHQDSCDFCFWGDDTNNYLYYLLMRTSAITGEPYQVEDLGHTEE